MLKTYSDKDNYIQRSENSPRNASVEERTREMKSEGERGRVCVCVCERERERENGRHGDENLAA